MMHSINSYLYLLIYVLLLIITCCKYYKRVRFSSGLVILVSYVVYGILSIFLFNNKYYGASYNELTLLPFLYLFIMFLIFFRPIFKYETSHVIGLQAPSHTLIIFFILVYAFCSLVTLPNTIESLHRGLTLLFIDISGGHDLYASAHENYSLRESGVSGIYGLFAIVHNIFGDIAMFIFSYYLSLKNKNKWILCLLGLIFLTDLLYPLSQGGRTGIVMKLFTLVMAITLFYPYYSEKIRNNVKRVLLLLLIILSIPFMALTISRFGDRDAGTGGGILLYIAQAPLNFNNYALNNGGIRYGDRTVNYFKQIVLKDTPKDIEQVRYEYSHLNMDDSVFSTFVGDFVLDFGPIGAFLIFLILSRYFYRKIRIRNGIVHFRVLLLVYFLLCIGMQGGMYLFNYAFMGNLTILAFIFMYIVLYADSCFSKSSCYLLKEF